MAEVGRNYIVRHPKQGVNVLLRPFPRGGIFSFLYKKEDKKGVRNEARNEKKLNTETGGKQQSSGEEHDDGCRRMLFEDVAYSRWAPLNPPKR